MPQARVKQRFGIGSKRITRIARQYNIPPHKSGGGRLSPELEAELYKMITEGATDREIINATGLDKRSISRRREKLDEPAVEETGASKPVMFKAAELVLVADKDRALLFDNQQCRVLFTSKEARQQFVADLQRQLEEGEWQASTPTQSASSRIY